MSIKRSIISGALLLTGLAIASGWILYGSKDKPVDPPTIKTAPRHVMPDEYECLTDDCWVYKENVLHCASSEDHSRYVRGDHSARCRYEAYICVVQDCTPEREIRKEANFNEIIRSIGDRVWSTWSQFQPDDLSVRVRLTLDDDGHIEGTQLLESSGSAEFDQQATEAILETQPFYEIRTTSPEMRALLTRIILSFGGVEVSTGESF